MKKTYLSNAFRLLLLILLPFASKASFVPIAGHIYKIVEYRNQGPTDFAIGVTGDNRYQPGHVVAFTGYEGAASQQWTFNPINFPGSPPAYEIINRNSRQYLESANAEIPNGYSSYPLSQNFQRYGQGDPSNALQTWEIVDDPNGGLGYRIILRANGNRISTQGSSASHIAIRESRNLQANPLAFVDVTANPNAALDLGVYQVINRYSGKALSATANDNRVSQWTNWGLAGQQWTFTNVEYGNYADPYAFYFTSRKAPQVMEIGGGGDLNAAGLLANMWDNYGNRNQQWSLRDVSNGQCLTLDEARDGRPCLIANSYSGLVLEIGAYFPLPRDYSRDDLPARQAYRSNGLNQQWYISYVSANRTSSSGQSQTPTPKVALPVNRTSSDNAFNQGLSVFPNPASEVLNISIGTVEIATVSITDARGRITSSCYKGDGKIDTSALPSGFYMITVSDGHREYRQKFVKE